MVNGNCAVPQSKVQVSYPDIRPIMRRMRSLVWVASYPKSGSTLLRLFISAYLGNGTVDINRYKGLGDTQRRRYQEISPKPLESLFPYESFYLRSTMLYRMAEEPHEQLVKTHCCFGSVMGIELIPQDLTKGAFVPIRDPRDVAVSYAYHSNTPVDKVIDLMADESAMASKHNIYTYMSSWSVHVRSWWRTAPTFGIPILLVPFEGMVLKPETTFKHVAIALLPEFNEIRFRKSVEAVRFENLERQEAINGFIERPETSEKFFRAGKVGQWRDVLTSAQSSRIESQHGELMHQLGYI